MPGRIPFGIYKIYPNSICTASPVVALGRIRIVYVDQLSIRIGSSSGRPGRRERDAIIAPTVELTTVSRQGKPVSHEGDRDPPLAGGRPFTTV